MLQSAHHYLTFRGMIKEPRHSRYISLSPDKHQICFCTTWLRNKIFFQRTNIRLGFCITHISAHLYFFKLWRTATKTTTASCKDDVFSCYVLVGTRQDTLVFTLQRYVVVTISAIGLGNRIMMHLGGSWLPKTHF